MTMQRLADYRMRCNISMVALAKEMNVSRQYIDQLEKGKGNNKTVSDSEKDKYLHALYRIVQARQSE